MLEEEEEEELLEDEDYYINGGHSGKVDKAEFDDYKDFMSSVIERLEATEKEN